MSAREERRNSQFPSRPSFHPVRVGVCLPSCSLQREGRHCQEHSTHMYTRAHTPHGLFPETFTPVLGPGVRPPPTHSPARPSSVQLPPPQETWRVLVPGLCTTPSPSTRPKSTGTSPPPIPKFCTLSAQEGVFGVQATPAVLSAPGTASPRDD